MTLPRAALLALALPGCVLYRTYPLLSLDVPGERDALELSGLASLDDGRVVAVAEGETSHLLVPVPDRPVAPGGLLDLLPLVDGRDSCDERKRGATVRCAARNFRAEVHLERQPIAWIDRGVGMPVDTEDLAPFGPERVLGVTKYSTVGRRTAFRRDLLARSRRQTERLFVLERREGRWYEQDLPEVTRLRDSLSDWGRAYCNDDMLVEGLAYDPGGERVFVGLSRCDGPALRVLSYPLGAARRGEVATITLEADGEGGPAEGVTALSWANGRLFALSAWDSYGHDTEPAFGGKLYEVHGGALSPVEINTRFRDRPSALAVLPAAASAGPGDVDAIVLFDNDAVARTAWRPNATVLDSPTPAPRDGAWAQLLSLESLDEPLELALNGFDLRWFQRDHRLSQIELGLARKADGRVGGWTRALGGRWQMEVGGSIGLWARGLGLGRPAGHNRQAVALTDLAGTGLRFTRYRARLSVVPRDRERENPSVATLLEDTSRDYTVALPLDPGEGALVLQGFAIDTSARAAEGICVAAIDLSLGRAGTAATVRSQLIGGICNDFDTRGPSLRHGKTTRPEGGVEVVVDFAVVDGAPSDSWSVATWDRSLPGPRSASGYASDPRRVTTDGMARAHIGCGQVRGQAYQPLPGRAAAPPESWLDRGVAVTGSPGGTSVLSGFAMAFDPVGFDPGSSRPLLTDDEALFRNNYVHRYLVRAFGQAGGAFVEAGFSHGIHRGSVGGDNSRPSALYARVDMAAFPGVDAPAYDTVAPSRSGDPNLLPEDGFIRWAEPFPLVTAPECAPQW
ncbi:MAG: hypothetical protein FJ090_06915 [Deltaproteobacteria bacterium]|nr:hypothetical protein [Deltaproteobacteria bacterium]